MSDAIAWQVELAIRPGELENFRTLTRAMVESTKGERGVLIYERFATLVERRRFMVFGTPSAELKRILDRFDATYLRPFDGFSLVQEEERQRHPSACQSGSGG